MFSQINRDLCAFLSNKIIFEANGDGCAGLICVMYVLIYKNIN